MFRVYYVQMERIGSNRFISACGNKMRWSTYDVVCLPVANNIYVVIINNHRARSISLYNRESKVLGQSPFLIRSAEVLHYSLFY
jgi:hypothetical protein